MSIRVHPSASVAPVRGCINVALGRREGEVGGRRGGEGGEGGGRGLNGENETV